MQNSLKDHVQDILDIDPAEQPSQRIRRRPQILGRQFLALPITAMLRRSESAVCSSNFRCRSRLIRPPSPDPK